MSVVWRLSDFERIIICSLVGTSVISLSAGYLITSAGYFLISGDYNVNNLNS